MSEDNSYNFFEDNEYYDTQNTSPSNDEALDFDELLAEIDSEYFSDDEAPINIAIPKNETISANDHIHISIPKKQSVAPASHRTDTAHVKASSNGFLDKVSRHKKGINISLVLIALCLIASIALMILTQGSNDPYSGRILPNVSIAGVDIGNMSKSEAIQAVSSAVGTDFSTNDMVVSIGKTTLVLAPGSTNAKLNIEAAVNAAYELGRTGSNSERQKVYREIQSGSTTVSLLPYLGLDTGYIRTAVKNHLAAIGSDYTPSSYVLDGTAPSLDADSFDESVPCQTLVLTLGSPGSNGDPDAVYSAVIEAYTNGNFHPVISSDIVPNFPEDLNPEQIFKEICSEPVEAIDGPDVTEPVPGTVGYTFSLSDAKAQLDNAKYGDVISIPMEYVMPSRLYVKGDFPETYGTYSTPLYDNEDYLHNLQLLCDALNGTVIQPGEVFSLNKDLPSRKDVNGFVSAPCHAAYCANQEMGGGADQFASTLLVAAAKANLSIVERFTADHVCPYTIRGTEITVSQQWQDLKIRNSHSTPIQIRAKVAGKQLTIRVLGQEALDYYIDLESQDNYTNPFSTIRVEKSAQDGYTNDQVLTEGVNGGAVQVYRVKYDSATGQELSRTYEGFYELRSVSQVIVSLIH